MIISIRGSNGAGKSTIIRDLMSRCETVKALLLPTRQKPAGYFLEPDKKPIFVPGHYEIANGGIDTIDINTAYGMMLAVHEFGCDCIYEGQNMADGAKRVLLMHKAGIDVRVIFLTTPLKECIASVRERGHSIKESTIEALHRKCDYQYSEFNAAGIKCVKASREDAFRYVLNWLEVS